jgi:hypothetical protein
MKRSGILLCIVMITSLSVFAQRGNQKWYNTAIGLRIEGGAGSSGTMGPTFEQALSNTTSFELMVLTNFSAGLEAVGMYKFIKTIPEVPAFLRWYYGFGVHVGAWNSGFNAGPDFLLGIGYSVSDAPINLCIDWHPSVDVIDTQFNAAKFGFSIRYIVE